MIIPTLPEVFGMAAEHQQLLADLDALAAEAAKRPATCEFAQALRHLTGRATRSKNSA
jgi:hypothetical protein